jgi:1-acyl-sn-glycerol-3-phosphate acyltransferase
MAAYFRRYLVRHMNAWRIARSGEFRLPAGAGPIVVYANHPSWWDAAIVVVAAAEFLPAHASFAPLDEAMLGKYGVFGRIGAFGVDIESPRGAAAFLAAATDILSRPDRALWITAQGRFADVRERPLGLKAGVARLPEIAPDALFVPMAIEYAFWEERGAEAFVAFGPPVTGRELLALPRPARRDRLEADLTATLDRLSRDVQARDPNRFRVLLQGRAGIGGVYDGWRRLAASWRGRPFDPSHSIRPGTVGRASSPPYAGERQPAEGRQGEGPWRAGSG